MPAPYSELHLCFHAAAGLHACGISEVLLFETELEQNAERPPLSDDSK